MLVDFLTKTYNHGLTYDRLCTLINRLYADSVVQVYYKEVMNEILDSLVDICKELVAQNDITGQTMYEALERLNLLHTGIELADELDTNVRPHVEKYLNELPKIDVVDDDGIRIVSSKKGFLSLVDTNDGKQLHSIINPMKEARCKAENIYNSEIGEYVFFGCGLGYLPYQLYLASDKSIKITVYLRSEKSYEYATAYGVLSFIPKENIEIYVVEGINEFIDSIANGQKEYYIFEPELKTLLPELRAPMNALVSRQDTLVTANYYLKYNMPCNMRNVGRFISKYDKKRIKEKIVVVAGGPSVDDNIEFLKDNRDNISIVCVGTIYKKLLFEGIVPDVVTIIDPFPTTLPQVIDTKKTDTALFVGLDAYWRVADVYPGKKYLLAMDDDFGNQKRVAREEGEQFFPLCTTVSTMAFYIAEYLGAKEILLLGTDFGYPSGNSHASGTAGKTKLDTSNLIEVPAMDGGKVYSSQKMIDYRTEMEEAISRVKHKNITVYNLSEKGAKIKGCSRIMG